MEEFTCRMPRILFGKGKHRELAAQVEGIGLRPFLAIDPYLESSGQLDEIVKRLRDASLATTPFSGITPDPDCFSVDDAGVMAREADCDFVIAVGGGSAIDFGKAVAVVATNPGTSWQYTRRKDHTPLVPSKATLPIVAVPSTAGTGSESTHYAVLSNPKIREKSSIVDDHIVPTLAIVDPELTYTMPPELTALTGVDVLAHAIESYINTRTTPFAKLMGIEAIRLVGRNLEGVVADGTDEAARAEMSWAATLAGIAIAHANPTLPHALGQAAGGFIHAPHGASVAALLVEILRLSVSADVEGFAEIAAALDPGAANLTADEGAERCAELVENLLGSIGCNPRLGDYGLAEKDIDRVTRIALTGYATGIGLHPKVVDEDEIKQIYRACL